MWLEMYINFDLLRRLVFNANEIPFNGRGKIDADAQGPTKAAS